jgi:hypothetical protein
VSCEFRNNQLVAFAEQRRGDFARRANLSQSALLIPPPNQNQNPRHPVPIRGAYRDVTDAGWDAMDAGGATDERAGLRTAKSCVLTPRRWRQVFPERSVQATVATSPVTEESAKETVKTIAQETPGVPVNLW